MATAKNETSKNPAIKLAKLAEIKKAATAIRAKSVREFCETVTDFDRLLQKHKKAFDADSRFTQAEKQSLLETWAQAIDVLDRERKSVKQTAAKLDNLLAEAQKQIEKEIEIETKVLRFQKAERERLIPPNWPALASVTVQQAAAILGVDERTVRNYIKEGKLQRKKRGRVTTQSLKNF